MPSFALYCDDSGTHAESDIAIAGCYITTVEQWQEWKRNWDEVNAREKFGVFHMADFVAKKKKFALPEWQDDVKRDRTIKALINVTTTRMRFAIAAAVVKSAYDEIVPADMRPRLGKNHYTFAIRMCVAFIENWREQHGYTEPMQYVFDRLTKGKGDIDDAFSIAASGGSEAVRRYGIYNDGWSFESKESIIQLQAPDIWAYENYRYSVDRFFPPVEKKKPLRESYRILRTKIPSKVRYMNRASLTDLVLKLRQSDNLSRSIVLTEEPSV